jgi:hypothetical protein
LLSEYAWLGSCGWPKVAVTWSPRPSPSLIDGHLAVGSSIQLLINLASIVLAGVLTLVVQRALQIGC